MFIAILTGSSWLPSPFTSSPPHKSSDSQATAPAVTLAGYDTLPANDQVNFYTPANSNPLLIVDCRQDLSRLTTTMINRMQCLPTLLKLVHLRSMLMPHSGTATQVCTGNFLKTASQLHIYTVRDFVFSSFYNTLEKVLLL